MKKMMLAIAVVGTLSACSSYEEDPVEEAAVEDNEKNEAEPIQEEQDAPLKEEAEPAVFSEMNVDQPPANKKVTAAGEVAMMTEPDMRDSFSLTTNDGMYTIMNMTETEVKEGSKVTVYGVVAAEKGVDGTPTIHATIIE